MYVIKLILQICILFGFSYLGSFVKDFLDIPLPGSIIGLLLLLLFLSLKIIPSKWIHDGANFLITFIPLLLVPVTISVMNYPDLFSGKGLILVGIIILSTILTMISVGWTSQLLEERVQNREEKVECNKSLSQ